MNEFCCFKLPSSRMSWYFCQPTVFKNPGINIRGVMVSLLRNSLTQSLTCSSSSPRLGHKAPNQILPVHPVLSSQAVLHPMLDPTPPAPSSLFSARWFFAGLFSSFQLGGLHLKTTSGILSLGILRTWPNYRSLRLLISRDIRIYTVCLLLQFLIEPYKKTALTLVL